MQTGWVIRQICMDCTVLCNECPLPGTLWLTEKYLTRGKLCHC